MKLPTLLAAVVLLAGCSGPSLDLDPRWAPLEVVVERPAVPGVDGTNVVTTTIGTRILTSDLDAWIKRYPEGSVKREALLRHEHVHAKSQLKHGRLGLARWLLRYTTDPDFMWKEESAGWREEILHLKRNFQWSRAKTDQVAKILSSYTAITFRGPVPMISEQDAKAWIEGVLRAG